LKKILVIGYFGYESDQLDGQTIKTRSIYFLLESHKAELKRDIIFFDTEQFKSSWSYFFILLYKITISEKIYYIGGSKNLKYIFPIIFLISKFLRINIHFVVVGGWLYDFLKSKPIHRFFLSKLKCIYSQTSLLTQLLTKNYGFNNVVKLNNFRILLPFRKKRQGDKYSRTKKLVYMGRVTPEKGLRTVFMIQKHIPQIFINNISIDVYGPISKDYEDEFFLKIKNSNNFVKYMGVLYPDKIYDTLSTYDLMLFPTRYFTEGFPGSILDAYIAGIPVIASNWKYANEFVVDNVSGIIVPFGDDEAFIKAVFNVVCDPDLLAILKIGASEQAHKYSSNAAWQVIKQHF
jgi:glycosyltransferase involved in cell wall biosynthesis